MAPETTPKKTVAAAKAESKLRKFVSVGAKINTPRGGKADLTINLRAYSGNSPVSFQKSVRLDAATLAKKYPAEWAAIEKELAAIGQGEAVAAFK